MEQRTAVVARRQHGCVTRRQLLDAGLSARQIDRRVEKGTLLPEFRGVYRVGHRAPSTGARYMAAVLASGAGAALNGRAGAHLHRLIKGAPPQPEVIAPTERRVKGVTVHRERRIDTRDVMKVRGIPVTTVARTLVDLAACLDEEQLARVCHEAGVLYETTSRHVGAVLKRRPRTKGATKLRRVMRGDVPALLSRLEAAFIALLRNDNLPLPQTNKPAGGKRIDCRWPGLTVELQSYQFHNSRHSWEQDHERRRQAYDRGDEFRTYTWKDVHEEPERMLAELRELLT